MSVKVKRVIEYKDIDLTLYEERISRKMDMTKFSEFLGISLTTYSKLERGIGTYSEEIIQKIERKLKRKLM